MRRPVLTCLVAGLLIGAAVLFFWRRETRPVAGPTNSPSATTVARPVVRAPRVATTNQTIVAESTAPAFLTGVNSAATNTAATNHLAYRLANTSKAVGQLLRDDRAVLLENALIDTGKPLGFKIPSNLQAAGDPGSYIVQARGPVDAAFRAALAAVGAEIVSYIPNNAYLVRASAAAAQQLKAQGAAQAVLPYEPVYKLKAELLGLALQDKPLPPDAKLNLLVFTDARTEVVAQLEKMQTRTLGEDRSPFGTVFTVQPGADWVALARLTGVQILERAYPRARANDLSRVRLGVATNSVTQTNYLGLTGTNVLVSLNDFGVDANHPDLTGRLFANTNAALVDTIGHGTHVAGIIAGSGLVSTNVTEARGSSNPGTNGQYRGVAPGAQLFVQRLGTGLDETPDATLQENAARTNAFISNNSWNYVGDSSYSLAAASYDAAVRDSLPGVPGSQPVLYVFAAGNNGAGGDAGLSGNPGSVLSPGTAKNVITVGAIELARDITNEVEKITGTVTNKTTPWKGMTSSGNQVAFFSGRGNVGIGVEGDFGRFKPDVVTPGTFVVSTRSTTWDQNAYYNPTNHHFTTLRDQVVLTNALSDYSIFLPENAVGFSITLFGNEDSPAPFPNLPIYVKKDGTPTAAVKDFVQTNFVSVPPDGGGVGTAVGQNWFYSIGNSTGEKVIFDILTDVITTNDLGNYYQVLSNLNNSISGTNNAGPRYYRYESGTSMAAASASGTLALMQEFFEQRILNPIIPAHVTNSPALMKALLINGARSVGNLYDFQVQSSINYQGWGLVKLNNSLPPGITNAGTSVFIGGPSLLTSIKLFDQEFYLALATGQRQTRIFKIDEAGRTLPLRVTLAWTDPPGNPAAGVKLVNDLDLVITNLDTGDIYFGNDIPGSSTFNFPWDTNAAPNLDSVNNVENIYLAPPLGTNYAITVLARRVNVNAVTAHPNDVVQDYALVVTSGNGEATNSLEWVSQTAILATEPPEVLNVTNSLTTPTFASAILVNQRVGANTPLLGTTNGITNQWKFYVLTNSTAFTNASFLISQQTDLATPRLGVFAEDSDQATRRYADIDLYVSQDAGLTNLDPAVVAASFKSLSRNDLSGDEFVAFTNSALGATYYVGVKSEDQMAAQFELWGIFSLLPLGAEDTNGYVQAYPMLGYEIPDGSPSHPGGTRFVAITRPALSGASESVRRVIATNNVSHENYGDIIATLDHNSRVVVLDNHRSLQTPPYPVPPGPYGFLYDDSGEGDNLTAIPPDGPGAFETYIGELPNGQWYFTYSDDALSQTGRVNDVRLKVERQPEDNNASSNNIVAPNSWRYFSRNVPVEATNLTVCITITSPSPLPLQLYIRKGARPTQTTYDYTLTINTNGCLSVDKSDLPPLSAGRYFIGVFNGNPAPQTFTYQSILQLGATPTPTLFGSTGNQPLLDDAVTNHTVFITNTAPIAQLDVGLRIDHPRVSDLAVTLVSPRGTRVLLVENRGGTDPNGFGSSLTVTNFIPVAASGGAAGQTNLIDTGATVGTVTIDYNFFDVPDQMTVYYQGALLKDTGMIPGAGRLTLNYGPGSTTFVEVRMNELGNTNSGTAWEYTVSSINNSHSYLIFTDNTNRSPTPIKFAAPPFVGTPGSVTPISDFEPPVVPGDYLAPTLGTPDGWDVVSNQVTVVNDPANAQAGSNFLALASGTISRILPTIAGRTYSLTYWFRGPAAVGWWRGENNAIDQIYGNNGSLQNVSFAAGEVGQAFTFSNAGIPHSRMSVVDQPVFVLTNSLSIEGWINPAGAGGNSGMIFWRGDCRGGYDPYFLSVNPDETVSFFIEDESGGPAASVSTPLPLANNQWWHLAATLDGNTGTMRIYTNGVLAAQATTTMRPFGILQPSEPTIGIGNVGTACWDFVPFNGKIDEISLYSRAISPSEIKAIFDAGAAGKFDPAASVPQNLAKAQVALGGETNLIFGNNTAWQSKGFVFTAATNGTPMSVTGLEPGMLLDSFTLTETAGPRYVLPEESLKAFEGENPFGLWKLEILDNRTGASNNVSLVDWQLQFIFQDNTPLPGALPPGLAVTNTVPPGGILYYTVDVPPWAQFATNRLLFASGPLNVLFNQNTPPAIGATNAGDLLIIGPATTGSYTLSTAGVPPLLPGQRYYLGVHNPGTSNVTFALQVDYDITALTNGVPLNSTLAPGALPRYFSYDTSTNATATTFQLLGLNGNVDLVARLGAPLPTLASFDYGSFNPGLNDEDILLLTNSTPVPLTPGRWYLGVFNRDIAPVTYDIVATEFTNALPGIITLTNGIPYFNTNSGVGDPNDYYRYVVTSSAARAQFEINNPSGDLVLVARKGLPLPDLGFNDYLSNHALTNDELIVVFTNSAPVALTPGNWFLTAINLTGGPVSYSIKATEWPVTGQPIVITNVTVASNSFCLTWTSLPGVHYFVEGLTNLGSTNWVIISPPITAVDYSTTYCVPLPSPFHFFRVTEGLTAPSAPITLPTVITLTNAVAYANTNLFTIPNIDYYRFVVSSNSVRAQFEINNPTGDLTLVARKGLPLPNLANFNYRSANSYTNDELIVVFDYSNPVPLSPGDWYLAAVNISGGPVAYSIKATEWPVYGTNLNATAFVSATNSFCLTWDSLIGAHYIVSGRPDFTGTNWTVISPTITATSTQTTWCVNLPSPYRFFRVTEGLALSTNLPPPPSAPAIGSVIATNSGFLLQWTAPISQQFQVQWATNLPPVPWFTFTNILTSTNGQFLFFDDGSQTGGFGRARFYRLRFYP